MNQHGIRLEVYVNMTGYLYVVIRDYGFAPNPFGSICTLATCKPKIREVAKEGDWIFGIGSKKYGVDKNLVYAMKITDKITFDEYWNNQKYKFKKPVMNGSLLQNYGDNIYHSVNNEWFQANSHHSLPDGKCNKYNLDRDLKSKFVLLSTHFYYFGAKPKKMPARFKDPFHWESAYRRNYRKIIERSKLDGFIRWIEESFSLGIHNDPYLFGNKFQRYNGL